MTSAAARMFTMIAFLGGTAGVLSQCSRPDADAPAAAVAALPLAPPVADDVPVPPGAGSGSPRELIETLLDDIYYGEPGALEGIALPLETFTRLRAAGNPGTAEAEWESYRATLSNTARELSRRLPASELSLRRVDLGPGSSTRGRTFRVDLGVERGRTLETGFRGELLEIDGAWFLFRILDE